MSLYIIGIARECSGCRCVPRARKKWGEGRIYGVKLSVHRGRERSPWEGMSHIFIGRRRVWRLILGVFHRVRGNNRVPQPKSWLRLCFT